MKNLLTVCLLAVLSSFALHAEELVHSEAGLEFNIPEGWKHEQEGDLLIAHNEANDLVLIFFVAHHGDAGQFIQNMGEELDKLMDDAKVTKGPKEEEINDLKQSYAEGEGKLKAADKFIPKGEDAEHTVDWDLTLVIGAKKALAVIAIGKIREDQETIHAIYNSIKKAP